MPVKIVFVDIVIVTRPGVKSRISQFPPYRSGCSLCHATGRGKKQLKFLYTTQAEVNPPAFVFFVNDARLMHFSYRRYLENKLRQSFGFAGTPLRLVFKTRGEQC